MHAVRQRYATGEGGATAVPYYAHGEQYKILDPKRVTPRRTLRTVALGVVVVVVAVRAIRMLVGLHSIGRP